MIAPINRIPSVKCTGSIVPIRILLFFLCKVQRIPVLSCVQYHRTSKPRCLASSSPLTPTTAKVPPTFLTCRNPNQIPGPVGQSCVLLINTKLDPGTHVFICLSDCNCNVYPQKDIPMNAQMNALTGKSLVHGSSIQLTWSCRSKVIN